MATLTRLLSAIVLMVMLLLAVGGLVWYLAYGIVGTPPSAAQVNMLEAPVEVRWGRQGDVAIRATSDRDVLRALGYVHGTRRAWSVALWRQAALGRLGEWFGEPALNLDRLARRLDLADRARSAFGSLSDEDRALLDAYTTGLNAALRQPEVRLAQEFVLLDLAPEPWQPWHTLAIERLMAWLASTLPPADAWTQAGPDVAAFFDADQELRQWLRLHGFENSVAWAARDSAGTHLFQRHVIGDTALPLLLEVRLDVRGEGSMWAASLPGTPFFPAGRSADQAWSLFLTSSVRLERVPWDSSRATLDYERLRTREGGERLAAFWRLPDHVLLEDAAPGVQPDSIWTLRWSGLTQGTDLNAWQALQAGRSLRFRLLRGDGLRLTRNGSWTVLGAPPVVERLPAGVYIGSTTWSRYGAQLLRTQETEHVELHAWITDAYSTWAAQAAPPLIAAVHLPDEAPATLRDAVTYLHNWDFAYDPPSIAASIFDRWMAEVEHASGALPAPGGVDSLLAPTLSRKLAQTVDSLAHAYGPDLSQWRWERVQPNRRRFPVWSVDTLRSATLAPVRTSRFAPLDLPGGGHPSTLDWGPSPVQYGLPAPSTWEAWIQTNDWGAVTVRRHRLDPDALFGRYLLSDRPPEPIRLDSTVAALHTTTLTPIASPR